MFFLHITAVANLSDEEPCAIYRATISKRAIVFTGKNDTVNIRGTCRFVFYGWTITHFCSSTRLLLNVIDTILSSERLVWREREPSNTSFQRGSLSLDHLLSPGDHRQVSHARSGRMGRRLIGVPLIVADFLRRCSTFTFAFELLAPTRARCSETDSDGDSPAIAIDRLLRATSDHKKR